MSDKNTFQLYGQSFQSKIIALLLTDKGYLEQIQDILESKYFENRANRWIIKNTLEYFNKYKNAPTMSALKVLVSQVEDDIFKISIIDSLREANKYSEAIDKDFIKEKSIDFCKNQKIKDAVIKSVDLIQDGDYDAIKVLIDDALKAGTERDVGHEYLIEIEERYSESARITTPTGWDVVDDLLQGGLGNGELGVVVAPAGVGKTWVLAAIGSGAMKNNKNLKKIIKPDLKYRYMYLITTKKDRKRLMKLFTYDILPYPKGDNVYYDDSYKPKVSKHNYW